MTKRRYGLFLWCLAAVMPVAASADVPKPNVYDGGNRWLITAFDDADAQHNEWATQGICFQPYAVVGTQIRGTWYSDTFPDWNGQYAQEGDQLVMHGDYAANVGHDGMKVELATDSPKDVAMGQWAEWREDAGNGSTVGFLNARMTRVGRCRRFHLTGELHAPLDLIDRLKIEIPQRLLEDGQAAQNPLDRGQVPIESIVAPLSEVLKQSLERLNSRGYVK
jgi:hypothetical protein